MLEKTLVLEKEGDSAQDTKHGRESNMELSLSAPLCGNLRLIRSLP